jgi:hypothetical protein
MQLSESQRKYLISEHVIGGGVFNLLLSAVLAWLAFRHHDVVPLRGDPGIVRDALGTVVILPFLTCLIVTGLVRKSVKAGKVEPTLGPSPQRSMLLWLPRSTFLRSLVFALLSLAFFAPVLLGLFLVSGIDHLSVGSFVAIKGLYAGVLAACNSPFIALYVLATSEAPAAVLSDEAELHQVESTLA